METLSFEKNIFNRKTIMNLKKALLLIGISLLIICTANAVSVLKYLPKNPSLDGSVDYRAEIQKALDENETVELVGSGNSKKPFIYGIMPSKINISKTFRSRSPYGIFVHSGHILRGSKSAVIKRIPNKGQMIITGKGVSVKGIIIDGNKKAHWPKFKELGKHDTGISIGNSNLIEDCYIYNNPGHAFSTHANNSVIRRCKAKNIGYIDIKFSAAYYKGSWDRWSGDAFYIRGHNNLVIDCDSEDAFRWDYTTCHAKSGGSIFINCKGRDVLWRSYGFIDIEGCDGAGSIMINCKSPDGSISISTSGSKLINCTGNRINVYSSDNVLISGCETFGGGLAVGGWSSSKKSYIRGGANPIVINNIINRSNPGPGVQQTSDWSLSVFSTDGKGIVAGNVLNEYKGRLGRGPGMKFDKVKAYDNIKKYGQFKLPENSKANEAKNKMKQVQTAASLRKFAQKILDIAKKLGIKGKIVVTTIVEPQASFIKDIKNIGEKQKWFLVGKMPKKVQQLAIGQHWDNVIGQYHNYAWYFIKVPLDMDNQHICDTVYLLFGGIDSECKVWLNGNYIGSHKGWKDPFKLQVPFKLLKWKDKDDPNTLAIKVYTPAGMGGIYANIATVMTKKNN